MIYGAVLAGGIGKRIERHSIPKQFISIGGIPVIVMTMRQLFANDKLDAIYVAVHEDWIDYAKNLFIESFSEGEIKRVFIVPGGKERIDSFTNIMEEIIEKRGLNSEDILICHDSVRPFVRQQMIDDCIEATLEDGVALTVIPVTDTIHCGNDEKFIDGTMNRNGLYNGQTPSGFNVSLLHDACEQISEADRSKFTGTTQLMLKLGYKIRIVKGHTSNIKITTDNDLDIADRMIRSEKRSRNVELLDCTLRDGGIVIGFDFGDNRMQEVKMCLEGAGVEYIECGYIDEKKGGVKDKSCFVDETAIEKALLYSGKKQGATYVAMIDYGTFDVNMLGIRTASGIDGIRLAFHKEHWKESIELGKVILSKGYQLYFQPMVSLRYTDEEFRELIVAFNRELPRASGFYIVDSFGQMDNMSVLHKLEIADQLVSPGVKIGFHAHNNRQMAFSNACAFAKHPVKHDIMLDASIMGMGKGAGNLCTELIAPVLAEEGKAYETIGIYEQISTYFARQLLNTPWGYSLDYYLSSLYGCTPSYIKIFVSDKRVTTDILVDLLRMMPEEKKAACDKNFAFDYLSVYFKGDKA